jgi:hypothetical protein
MPSTIVHKSPQLTRDDAAPILATKTLIEDFDRIAAAAARLAEQDNRDGEPVAVIKGSPMAQESTGPLDPFREGLRALDAALRELRQELFKLRRDNAALAARLTKRRRTARKCLS